MTQKINQRKVKSVERLTERYGEGYEKSNIFGKVKCQHRCNCDTTSCNDCKISKQLEKHGEYGDKIENGTLVEVVRCKDCKHFQKSNLNFGDCKYMYNEVQIDDYCSYGKLKEVN